MKPIRKLFSYYAAYHQHGPLLLRYLSVLGLVGFPLLYLLRFLRPQAGYDDLPFRVFDGLICLLLFLRDRWPASLTRYYLPYSYVVLIVTLPLTFVFTSLKNGGGPAAVANTFLVVFLLILLADWRNMIVMLVVGFASGALLYAATDASPRLPMDYVARLPVLIAAIIGGSLFKFALERSTAEKVRYAYASLAGSIAHEMRNPLAQLKHSLDHIQQALPAPSVNAQPQAIDAESADLLYKHLADGEIAVKRGLQVVAMTLDEVNAKPLDPAGFAYLSAADVCRKAMEEYGHESEDQRAKVSLDVVRDFIFRGDETAYIFVLFNLIKNALYYSSLQSDVRLVIRVADDKVAVQDNGPGIPPDVIAGLFEPFATRGKRGGTGLGLAYCLRVMRAFGGRITCESVLGEHTQFTMSFPPVNAQEREAQRLATLAEARQVFAGRRLLVVDDDAALRTMTRHKLIALDATIDEAADGHQAKALLGASSYALVLLDLNMPGMDGYALAEGIRAGFAPDNQDVCIVAYTSEPAHLARVKTKKAGMDGFVSKPCDQAPLVQALQRAFQDPGNRTLPHANVLAGRRILVADDSRYQRGVLAAYLKHGGAIVVEAAHGADVLAQLTASAEWDAIVMDIQMPGMSGLETTQAIRAAGMPWSKVPIIAVTAHSDDASMAAARAAGMNDFITKPVESAVLFSKVGQLIRAAAPGLAALPVEWSTASPHPVPDGENSWLLNADRLESYQRIGILEDLVNDFVPEISRLVTRLEAAVAQENWQQSLDTLHSLLGISGDAGASALYQLVRPAYVRMVEGRAWPTGSAWLGEIVAVSSQTLKALTDYCAANAVPDPA
jgi:two-component system CAI-1 autoinducer sensor kinase/phosphatase CqsS